MTRPQASAQPGPSLLVVPGLLGVAAYVVALAIAITGSFDIWGGLVLMPPLVLLTMAAVTRHARREGDLSMVRLLRAAVVAKVVVGTVARYVVVFSVYGGAADSQAYHEAGSALAAAFRGGDLSADLGGRSAGTQAVNLITGIVYTVIGPTKLGGFLVFSWLAFVGLFLFYRALRLALPAADHRRYAKFVFFLPTLLFWPSSIGKDAWLVFTLGLAAYGASRIYARLPLGFVPLSVGLWGTAIVRPHMTVIMFGAVAAGFLFRRATGRRRGGKLVGLALMLAIGVVVVGRFESYFGLGGLDAESVEALLEQTEKRTAQGGSGFDPVGARNPLSLPAAAVAVLFRPFPFEANNPQALGSAIEGAVLLLVCLASARRLAAAARLGVGNGYVALCWVYTVLFVAAFSSVGNFGILARQRAQLLPIFVVLLCLPSRRRPAPPPATGSPVRWEPASRPS